MHIWDIMHYVRLESRSTNEDYKSPGRMETKMQLPLRVLVTREAAPICAHQCRQGVIKVWQREQLFVRAACCPHSLTLKSGTHQECPRITSSRQHPKVLCQARNALGPLRGPR